MIRSLVQSSLLALAALPNASSDGFDAGLATISKDDLQAHLRALPGPEREGRDKLDVE